MKRLFRGRTKVLGIAFLIGILAVAGWRVGKVLGAANAGSAVAVKYYPDSDTLEASGYPFFTMADASKRIPAINQWIRTDKGKVELSNFMKGTIVYFAKNTAPKALDEILAVNIPEQPVLSLVKFDPTAMSTVEDEYGYETEVEANAPDKFEFVTTLRVKHEKKVTNEKISVDPKYIQIRVNDNSVWESFSTKMTNALLEKLQKNGTTVSLRIAPATTVEAKVSGRDVLLKDQSVIINKKKRAARFVEIEEDDDIWNDEEEESEEEESEFDQAAGRIFRPGISKQFKIPKKALGPQPPIDYENHALNIKDGYSYAALASSGAEPSWMEFDEWETPERIFFGYSGSVLVPQYYAVKTDTDFDKKIQESLPHFFTIPVDTALSDHADVEVSGVYEGDATLTITNKGKGAVKYQYALVDLAGTNEGLFETKKLNKNTTIHYFNYEAAFEQIDYSMLEWINIATAKTTGKASVKISADDLYGKQIMVRKAAVGTNFSSSVEVFRAPLDEDSGWYKIAESEYTDEFLDGNGGMPCPHISVRYEEEANRFILKITGGTKINSKNLAIKVGNRKNVSYKIGNIDKNGEIIVTFPSIKEFLEEEEVQFVFKAGFIHETVTNGEYTVTVVPNS